MESAFVTPDGLETQFHAKNATKIASAVRAQRIQIVQRAMQTQLSDSWNVNLQRRMVWIFKFLLTMRP